MDIPELCRSTATALQARIAAREVSCEEVMRELHAAVRGLWQGSLKTIDPGGSARRGLRLVDGAGEIRISRPREIEFLTDRTAVEVRAERV